MQTAYIVPVTYRCSWHHTGIPGTIQVFHECELYCNLLTPQSLLSWASGQSANSRSIVSGFRDPVPRSSLVTDRNHMLLFLPFSTFAWLCFSPSSKQGKNSIPHICPP